MANNPTPNKCPKDCSSKNQNGSCPRHSLVKMGIMLQNGADHFKNKNAKGDLVNPYWYSYVKNNRSSLHGVIIPGMIRRFNESAMRHVTRKLVFYDNQTGQFITSKEIS